MHPSRAHRVLYSVLPFVTALGFMLLGILLTPPALRVITPPLLLPALYFWAVRDPHAVSPLLVFALGILCDIIMGLPLGAMPLTALFLVWLARRDEHLDRRGFKGIWLRFCGYGILAMALLTLMLSLYQWRMMALPPVIIQTLLMLASYPLIHAILSRLTGERRG